MLPFVMRTSSGITPPLCCAFQINHHARTPRHNNYNRYDELGTAQFVTLVLGSDVLLLFARVGSLIWLHATLHQVLY